MTKMLTIKNCCVITLALVALLLFSKNASALTISPPKTELSADPGSVLHGQLKLINDERQSKTVYFLIRNFEAKNESGTPDFPEKQQNLATWISIQPSATVGPKQDILVPYTITVPNNAEPSGYFAVIFAASLPPGADGGGQVALGTDLGNLVLLRVNGNLTEGANILEFNTKDKKHWFSSLPIDFYYRFQNNGDSWVKPLGDIVIKNIFGKNTKIVPTNAEGGNVLPRSIRRYEVSWLTLKGQVEDRSNARPPEPPKDFWKKVGYEWRYSPLGLRYTAKLGLTFGATQDHDRASIVVWIIPWHLLLVVIPSAILLLALLWFFIVRYNRYVIRQAQKKK